MDRAGFVRWQHVHQITGAVAQEGTAQSGQRSEDQFASCRHADNQRDGFGGLGVDQLRQEVILVDAHVGWLGPRVIRRIPPGAELGGAGVIEHFRAPRGGEAPPGARNARSGLTGLHEPLHRGGLEIDALHAGDLGEVQCVGRRADQDADVLFEDRLQPLSGGLCSTGERQRTHPLSRLEGSPEADERAKGEGNENAIGCVDSRRLQNSSPAVEKSLPVAGGVEPTHRTSGRAGGLVQADIPVQRFGEAGTIGWVRLVVLDQFRLRGQRQGRKDASGNEDGSNDSGSSFRR